MIGKLPLLGFADGKLSVRHPAAGTFELLASQLAGAQAVTRIAVPGQPGVRAFEVQRDGRGPLTVLWDHRDAFAGEDEPAVRVILPWTDGTCVVTDAFGAARAERPAGGQVVLPVSVTPLFVSVT